MHVDNPIVAGWVERLRQQPGALDQYHPRSSNGDALDRDMVQAIPLMDPVRTEVAGLPWPKLDRRADFDPLKGPIEQRARAIVPRIVRGLLFRFGIDDHRLLRRALRAIASDLIGARAAHSAALSIEHDLRRRHLI